MTWYPFSNVISVTPVLTTDAYSSGDAVGALQTISGLNVATGTVPYLESLVVLDDADQKADLTILFFDSNPTTATVTDNDAFAFGDNFTEVIGRVDVVADDYITFDSVATAALKDIDLALKPASGTTIYAVVVTTGTPTYAAGSLTFRYGFGQR